MKSNDVVHAWSKGEAAHTKHLRTDGQTLWSYALPIAKHSSINGNNYDLILNYWYSKTTSRHINLAKQHSVSMVEVHFSLEKFDPIKELEYMETRINEELVKVLDRVNMNQIQKIKKLREEYYYVCRLFGINKKLRFTASWKVLRQIIFKYKKLCLRKAL